MCPGSEGRETAEVLEPRRLSGEGFHAQNCLRRERESWYPFCSDIKGA